MTRLHEKEALEVLRAAGWTGEGYTAIASKTYDTAVGPKTAFAYLTNVRAGDPNITLMGDYQSEGRNILEPWGVLLPVAAGPEEVRELVKRFASQTDAAVADSYAVRLLKT